MSYEEMKSILEEWNSDNNPNKDKAIEKILDSINKNETTLYLDNLELNDIPPALEHLTNLTFINLDNNNISDISRLSSMSSLYTISLNNNKISDISALNDMNNLNFVYLNSNNISDVSVLRDLPELEIIYLNNNNIELMPELEGCTNLEELHLDDNNISTSSSLNNLSKLASLSLEGNELQQLPDELFSRDIHPSLELIALGNNLFTNEVMLQFNDKVSGRGITIEYDMGGDDEESLTDEDFQEVLSEIFEIENAEEIDDQKSQLYLFVENDEDLSSFREFLTSCVRSENWQSNKKSFCQGLLKLIENISRNDELKGSVEAIASTFISSQGLSVTCGDRSALSFIHMQLAANSSHQNLSEMSFGELTQYARNQGFSSWLTEKSEERIKNIRVTGGALDEIETYMAYLTLGDSEKLCLGLDSLLMRYPDHANVTKTDLEETYQEALQRENEITYSYMKDHMQDCSNLSFVGGVISDIMNNPDFSSQDGEDEYGEAHIKRINEMKTGLWRDIASQVQKIMREKEGQLTNDDTPSGKSLRRESNSEEENDRSSPLKGEDNQPNKKPKTR